MKYLPLLFCMLASHASLANNNIPPEEKSLNEQYRELTSEIVVYDGYRMVKMFVMDRFWKTVMDSIGVEQSKRKEAEVTSIELRKKVDLLNAKMQTKQASLEGLEYAGEHIVFFGKDFTKAGFITIATIVVAVLITLLVLAVLSTRVSIVAVKETKKLYDNMCHEFEDYKHHSVEKQIKLSRELQTQRNRLEAIKASS